MQPFTPPEPPWLDRCLFPFESRFIEVNGNRIHYVDEGEGPTLLFLHPSPAWSFIYREMIGALRQAYRVVALDFPGYGLSKAAKDFGFQAEEHAHIIERFVHARNLDDLVLLGHSQSGPIGLYATSRIAERMAGLVVMNTFGWRLDAYPSTRRVLGLIGSRAYGLADGVVAARQLLARGGAEHAAHRSFRIIVSYFFRTHATFHRKTHRRSWQQPSTLGTATWCSLFRPPGDTLPRRSLMSKLTNLTGLTAIVTGTSRGIGPHIARALSAQGMRLVLAARAHEELQNVAAQINSEGGEAIAVPTDISDRADLHALIATATRRFGGVDVLVNNAGGDPLRAFVGYSAQDVDDVLGVNLIGPIELTRLLLPGMLERRRGHIVNISSLAGSMGFPYTEVYAAAKDGLVGFSRVLRADYRSRGVSSSALILGAVAGDGQGQRSLDELGISMPRTARAMASSPRDVANAVVRAITRDHPVVVVMPGPGGRMKSLMDAFPDLGPKMNEMGGATTMVKQLAELRAQTSAAESAA